MWWVKLEKRSLISFYSSLWLKQRVRNVFNSISWWVLCFCSVSSSKSVQIVITVVVPLFSVTTLSIGLNASTTTEYDFCNYKYFLNLFLLLLLLTLFVPFKRKLKYGWALWELRLFANSGVHLISPQIHLTT